MTLPERIEKVRYYGILVSDDGFYCTPTGPVHIDDLELGRVLIVHDDLLAACKAQHAAIDLLLAMLIVHKPGFMPSKSGQPWKAMLAGHAAIAKAEDHNR